MYILKSACGYLFTIEVKLIFVHAARFSITTSLPPLDQSICFASNNQKTTTRFNVPSRHCGLIGFLPDVGLFYFHHSLLEVQRKEGGLDCGRKGGAKLGKRDMGNDFLPAYFPSIINKFDR